MKKTIILPLATVVFLACNNNSATNENTKTETHADTTATTAAPQSNPMMDAMHSMMQQMQQMQMNGDPDKDFAMMMKMHHQGAIDMANYEMQHGTDSMIKGMTQKMVEEQTKEIQELETFANAASGRKADSSFGKQIMQAMDKMHNQAMSATMSGNTDKDFVAMMIPHHQSAIEMAEIYLQHGRNAKLKSMASKNISDQKKEIDQMESWLKSH